MKKRVDNQRFEEIDEHNQPTEPLQPLILSPNVASSSPNQETIPTFSEKQPEERFTLLPARPASKLVESAPYPYLPPNPLQPANAKRQPARPSSQPRAASPSQQAYRASRYKPFPLLVGLAFVMLQFLLLARFTLKMLPMSMDLAWVGPVYVFSDVFIAPFRALWLQLPLFAVIPVHIEIYTLLAILVYGIVSRVLVHLLKSFLNAR